MIEDRQQGIDNERSETGLYILFLACVIFLIFSSCLKDKRRDDVVKIVREWTGKEIKFPKELFCISMQKDTTCVDLYSENFKILLYVDSLGCTSCRLKLSEWKKIIRESDSLFIRNLEFVFVFQPKKRDEMEVQFILLSEEFFHPVIIDKGNEIDKINKFPSNPEHQCFLLDKDNKVIMVGNPSFSSGIWTLIYNTKPFNQQML